MIKIIWDAMTGVSEKLSNEIIENIRKKENKDAR